MSIRLRFRCGAKGKAPPLHSIDGFSIEQLGCKRVHWEKRDAAGEMKRYDSTMDESSVLFPFASVSSLEVKRTSVVFLALAIVT